MSSLDALIGIVRAQLNDVRRALAAAETAHARALMRIADLDGGRQEIAARHAASWSNYGNYAAQRAADRRALNADEAAFAREAETLRARLIEAHAELAKLERLAALEIVQEEEDRAPHKAASASG